MIDARMEELLHRELDGQATEEQRAELLDRLPSSPDGQTYQEDLKQMQQVLHSTREVEPPAGWRQDILAKVAAVQPPWSLDETRDRATGNLQEAPRGRNLGQRLLDSLREGLRPREAFAFGLGAAACLVIVFLAGWDRFESIGFPDGALPGSMIPLESTETLQTIDRSALEMDGIKTVAVLMRAENLLHLTVQIDAPVAAGIEIIYEHEALLARGLSQAGVSRPLLASLADERIAISHMDVGVTGVGEYTITFEERLARPSMILVQIERNGQRQQIQLQTDN